MTRRANCASNAAAVTELRALRPHARGTRARLRVYAVPVLQAAIAAELAASDTRPILISMLEAELRRRASETQES